MRLYYFLFIKLYIYIYIACHPLCAECTSTLPKYMSDCQVCLFSPLIYVDPIKHECSCIPNYYYNETEKICKVCHEYCTECSGPTNYECLPGKCNFQDDAYPYLIYNPNICLPWCLGISGHNLFVDNSTIPLQCQVCHPNCKSCNGLTASSCIECNEPYFLVKQSECLELSCPNGSVPHSNKNICLECHEYCEGCIKEPNTCITCKWPYLFENNFCLEECSKGYANTTQENCTICPESCSQCKFDVALNQLICLICQKGYFLQDYKCSSICPFGTYGNQTLGLCEQCVPACSTCTGPTNMDCLLCNHLMGFAPHQGKCLQQNCDEIQFFNSQYKCQRNNYIYIYIYRMS